jgi:hypothetical protein
MTHDDRDRLAALVDRLWSPDNHAPGGIGADVPGLVRELRDCVTLIAGLIAIEAQEDSNG